MISGVKKWRKCSPVWFTIIFDGQMPTLVSVHMNGTHKKDVSMLLLYYGRPNPMTLQYVSIRQLSFEEDEQPKTENCMEAIMHKLRIQAQLSKTENNAIPSGCLKYVANQVRGS
jgi:hypothetical protein